MELNKDPGTPGSTRTRSSASNDRVAPDVQLAGFHPPIYNVPDPIWQGVLNQTTKHPDYLVQRGNNQFQITDRNTGDSIVYRNSSSTANVIPPSTPKLDSSSTFAHSGHPRTPINSNNSPGSSFVKAGGMNYQNYNDSPGGPGSNPRQAPPSPSQGMNHPNGMNGGMGMGGMAGFPTPAGHQQDLNYIMSMVDELSGVLRKNQDLTAGVVEKMGLVREMAANLDLSNDQLVAAVAAELSSGSSNLEKECSELRKRLDKAEFDKAENWKLACHGANILADLTEKMHKFRERTDADILAWHKNYRQQLADEREENLNLRNQINDMRAAACRANGHLRDMRRYLDDHDERNELRIQNIALRQEKRFWKRMAMPYIPEDDSEWSDDDDLIDPEEKKRQAAIKADKERKDKEDAESGEGATA